jgi:hypothetical protein
VFEFSKARMAQCLMNAYPHESVDIRSLSELRVLNANFFSGGEPFLKGGLSGEEVPTIQDSFAAIARMVGVTATLNEQPYGEAVQEFLNAATSHPFRLGYRLRTWFLLLVYDGINLYCEQKDFPVLTSFSESRLLGVMNSANLPASVRRAASLGVEYLRNYPLKYFLLEDSKILTNDACSSLFDLSRLINTL